MADQPEKSKTPMRLWLRVVLGVSLALNLLVLGMVGGAVMRFGGADGMRPPPRTIGAVLFRELPREDRRELWTRWSGTHDERHARQSAEAQALSAAVRATPFDAQALARMLEQQAGLRAGFQKSVQAAWLARVATMSGPERQAYADRLENALKRPWFRNRHKNRRDDAD